MNVKESVGDRNGIKYMPVNGMGSQKFVENREIDDEAETTSLFSTRKGVLAKKSAKPRRRVQWNDKNGNKLAEVLEYQPRESCLLGTKLLIKIPHSCGQSANNQFHQQAYIDC